jgi:ABC-type multidrug transport system permease subunit
MRFLWISTVKDLRRLRRDPISIAMWIAIPLVLAVLMNIVFGGGEATPQGLLLVQDEDKTFVSNLLTGAFRSGPLAKMLLLEDVKPEEGRARIDRGDGSALLIIPKGLQKAYLEKQPFRLQLITNPAQRILPKIVDETLSMMIDASFYVDALFGDQLRTFDLTKPPSEQMIVAASVMNNRTAQKLLKSLNPPLIELETNVVQEHPQSFASLFLPSMIFMSLLFMANALAGDIWTERLRGTLRRLVATPAALGAFLAGRLLFVGIVLFAVALLGLFGLRWLAGVPVANLTAAVLWLTFSGTALYLLFLLLLLQASTQRTANMLGNLVVFPLALVGGCFFPFELMPNVMASIGRLTPNGWAIVQFKAILTGSANIAGLAVAFGGLIGVSLVAYLLTMRRLRRFARIE